MLTSFIIRKMLDAQLKNVPADQKEKIIAAFEKNPELFKKIALEIESEIKNGVDQKIAAMRVAEKYKSEISALIGNGNK